MKESGKERLKSTIYESTLSTADAVPLPRWGRQISSGYAEILRLRPQLFWHSLSHIRRFSPLRMTKWGDARRLEDRSQMSGV